MEVVILPDAAGGRVSPTRSTVSYRTSLTRCWGCDGELAARCLRRTRTTAPGRQPPFRRATAFLLDEYIGLPPEHPESYRASSPRNFTGLIDIDPANVHVPDGTAVDVEAACAGYETMIRAAGGIDLQLLGIGADGHLGFNEPTSSLASRTRVKTLTEQTRKDNNRFFADLDEVPRHVVTQGIGTILDARHLVLIAIGAGKAEPIARAVEGPVASMCPASAIQLHPRATVVVDEAAAAQLTLADYYRPPSPTNHHGSPSERTTSPVTRT